MTYDEKIKAMLSDALRPIAVHHVAVQAETYTGPDASAGSPLDILLRAPVSAGEQVLAREVKRLRAELAEANRAVSSAGAHVWRQQHVGAHKQDRYDAIAWCEANTARCVCTKCAAAWKRGDPSEAKP